MHDPIQYTVNIHLNEMKAYLGINILMGIHVLPDIYSY